MPGLVNGEEPLAEHMDSLNDPGFEFLLAELAAEEAASGSRPTVISAPRAQASP